MGRVGGSGGCTARGWGRRRRSRRRRGRRRSRRRRGRRRRTRRRVQGGGGAPAAALCVKAAGELPLLHLPLHQLHQLHQLQLHHRLISLMSTTMPLLHQSSYVEFTTKVVPMVPSIQRPLTNQRPNSTTRTTPKLTLMLLKKVVLPTCQLKRGPTHQTDAQPCTEWCLLSSTKTAFHQMSKLVIAPDTIADIADIDDDVC